MESFIVTHMDKVFIKSLLYLNINFVCMHVVWPNCLWEMYVYGMEHRY